MTQIRVPTPKKVRTVRAVRRIGYRVITLPGIQFVERRYTAEHIPPHLMRLYQFLLKLIWMKGALTAHLATRLGYDQTVLKPAHSRGFVETQNRHIKLSESIQHTIREMIGDAPRWIYA